MDARLDQLRDGAVHAHIFECELIGTRAVRIEYGTCFLVDERERPSANLHAAAAVAALTKEHPGVDALSALGDAHIAVHEVFHLDARAHAKECKLGERHLSADDDARDAILLEFFDGMLVVRVHHDGRMQGDCDAHFVHKFEHGKVLYENRIRTDLTEIGKVVPQCGEFLVADEIVQCNVEMYAVCMRVVNGFLQPFVIKVKVALVEPHIEMFAAEVDGICACLDSCRHGIPCTGGSEQLDGFTV